MAKKSSSGHHKPTTAHGKGPARKQQAPERASTATLVRPDGQPGPSAANVVADSAPAAKAQPAPAPKSQPAATRSTLATRPASKPPVNKPAPTSATSPATPTASASVAATTAAKPAASPAETPARPAAPRPAVSAREQNARMARVRATQRARTEHLISAENYSYVLGDLKLVVGLASAAFIVLIALTFVLPH